MKHRLLVGGLVFLALSFLAVWKVRKAGEEGPAAGAPSSADLEKALPKLTADQVEVLDVRAPGKEEVILLAKREGGWRVVVPFDAKADEDAVKDALEKLANLKVKRIAGTNPASHERFGLIEPLAVKVVANAGGKPLLSLLIGGFGGGGTFVREPDKDTVYAVEGSINYAFNKDLKSWRDREILDLDVASIVDVKWVNGKDVFHFVREEGAASDPGAWKPGPGAKPVKDFTSSSVHSVVTALARLRASDFAPNDAPMEALRDPKVPTATVALTSLAPLADGAPADSPRARVTHTVHVGKKNEAGLFYVAVEGSPTTFAVSEYVAKRITPTAEDFQAPKAPPAGAEAPQAPGGPGGEGSIPPEIMKQLEAQMRAQGR